MIKSMLKFIVKEMARSKDNRIRISKLRAEVDSLRDTLERSITLLQDRNDILVHNTHVRLSTIESTLEALDIDVEDYDEGVEV